MAVFRDPNITVRPLRAFCRAEGYGPSTVYALIAAGEIESVRVGGRRYVIMSSYWDMLDRALAAEKAQPRHCIRVAALAAKKPAQHPADSGIDAELASLQARDRAASRSNNEPPF